MRITVIIPTMNRLESLMETVHSYENGISIPEQIVIVDQTQDLELRRKIRACLSEVDSQIKVNYIYQDVPSSTKARNIGIKNAENDIIIFSDDDVTVEKETIFNIRQIMENNSISMIAGINSLYGVESSKLGYLFAKKSFKFRHCGHVTKSMLGRFPNEKVIGDVDTQWAMGFFFVIRKKLLESWGLCWDENLVSYAYAEDLDFSYSYYKKSNEHNMRCILCDKVIVEHREAVEYRIPSKKTTMMYVLNRTYLRYKHEMGMESSFAFFICHCGDILIRLLRQEPIIDFCTALKVCEHHKRELRSGIIKPEWYDEE